MTRFILWLNRFIGTRNLFFASIEREARVEVPGIGGDLLASKFFLIPIVT